MLGADFRPWGELSWLMSKHSKIRWNVIGCISFEERCYGLQSKLTKDDVDQNLYFHIQPPSSYISDSQNEKLLANRKKLQECGVGDDEVIEVHLLESINTFVQPTQEFIANCNSNVILDISSFPKRFFFPLLKTLLKNEIQNLLVTYTKAQSYSKSELSWDPSDWSHIPTFMSGSFREPEPELAIISVGFMPLGLPKLLTGNYQDAEVRLIFPHPPGPPNYQRNWEFVRQIVDSYPSIAVNEMLRVHALDTSDAFNRICDLTNGGARACILAPYGPKPISLAMALYAINKGVPVYYTQPGFYSPEYSSGFRETYAYWIVRNGNALYET